jgi:hypothetical protein
MVARMAEVRCPMCGKPNPEDQDECQYCGARLKPVVASNPDSSKSLKPGQEPTKKVTSEFEKVKLTGEGPIRPGEAPTKKNTAELERALPSWLRSLREGKRPVEGEALPEPSSEESVSETSEPAPAADSPGDLPDWLAGLGKAASDEEGVPDWLADLRDDEKSEQPVGASGEQEPAPQMDDNEDWMKRLENQRIGSASDPVETARLSDLEPPLGNSSTEPAPESDFPDWLQRLQSSVPNVLEPLADSNGEDTTPDNQPDLPEINPQAPLAVSGAEEPAPENGLPDWLEELKKKSIAPENASSPEAAESDRDWMSGFENRPATPPPPPDENFPDWLSKLESTSGSEPGAPSALIGGGQPVGDKPPENTPDWLTQLQAQANSTGEGDKPANSFKPDSNPPKSAEALPDWLTRIENNAPPSGDPPALVDDNKGILPASEPGTAYSTEIPDWLARVNPLQGSERGTENKEPQPDSEDLEAADLPSWVQAMRPVEAVVESKSSELNETEVTELSGPLAGLNGVLPSGPGLGMLRKPPAYSSKLQVSDGQQRYATVLEQLVSGETHPRTVGSVHLRSNRLWRWLIAGLLILAAGLPFASSAHFAPATLLVSSDKGASSQIIDGLPANKPVLVAFDYEPALSGELEAVAAPIMDQILSKGIPLGLLSTSPTGPALAENFFKTTSLVNVHQYRNGEQYVNLGYLAGGPAGISYLANSLTDAMPLSVDGTPAWDSGPLQGIQSVSDFAAVIILTDNADTGRNWIEQAGPRLGDKPMLMIISAQAEPMIRPYFDSGQLKGLISGLSDAKIYEQALNRPGLATHYWNSFSVGMLVAELLIAIGAILGVMSDRRIAHKESKGEA